MATLQFGVDVRNARLNAIETQIGTAPMIEIRTGAMPGSCAAVATGNVLVQQALPSDWLTVAAAGVKSKNGSWALTGLSNIATSNAGYFRINLGSPSDCQIQGDITATGGGGAMTMDNISIAASQPVTVNTFDLTDGNA
jgi:hypothetical protein